MLDVHPPHTPTHSWKDFFIHIATIVVGLLIAVGLEQTVELIHHHRERNELTENLHAEAEQNLPVLEHDFEAADADSRWEKAILSALQNPTDTGTLLTVTLPAREPAPVDHSPDRAAWPVAKANGKAALLPESLAAIYDRCDTDAGESFTAFSARLQAGTQADAAESRFGVKLEPGTVIQLSAMARDELARAHALLLGTTRDYAFWTLAYHGCSNAIAHNAQTRAEVDSYYGGFSSVFSK